jgi:hypothetical protein
MFSAKFALPLAFALTCAAAAPSLAGEASDIAREAKVPVPVVENVLSAIDTYFAAPEAPGNRLTSGIIKELALKATRSRMGSLAESLPGKSSDSSFEDKNATYTVSVRTVRHETTETGECVDNRATATASEGVPVVKDGSFGFDLVHPRVTSHSWSINFCRTPINGGSDFSEWKLALERK